MALRNTSDSYGSVAKFFHWLIALLIIVMLIVGFVMGSVPDKSLKMQIYNLHKLTGLTILSLVILRLCWRWLNPVPTLPAMPRWELFLEQMVKVGLYFCLLLMPLSGWIFSTAAGKPPHLGHWLLAMPGIPESKTLRDVFDNVHAAVAWVLMVLLALHLAGAFKHHFINKDNVLRRMMPGRKS